MQQTIDQLQKQNAQLLNEISVYKLIAKLAEGKEKAVDQTQALKAEAEAQIADLNQRIQGYQAENAELTQKLKTSIDS